MRTLDEIKVLFQENLEKNYDKNYNLFYQEYKELLQEVKKIGRIESHEFKCWSEEIINMTENIKRLIEYKNKNEA